MERVKTGAASIALLMLALTACGSASETSGNGTTGGSAPDNIQAPSSIVGEESCTDPVPQGWGGSFMDYVADGDAGDPRDVICRVTGAKGAIELIILDGEDGKPESTPEYYPLFDEVKGVFYLFLWVEGERQRLGSRSYKAPRGYVRPDPGKYVPPARPGLVTNEPTTGSSTGSTETDDGSSDRRDSTATGGSQRDDEPIDESSEPQDDSATTAGSGDTGETSACKWKPARYVYDPRTRRYKWQYGWVCR